MREGRRVGSRCRGAQQRNVVRSGLPITRASGVFDHEMWTSETRTPEFYPDAVTLAPQVADATWLRRGEASRGGSVKDSFSSLDLVPFGFRVLLDAQWIVLAPRAAVRGDGGTPWSRVTTETG